MAASIPARECFVRGRSDLSVPSGDSNAARSDACSAACPEFAGELLDDILRCETTANMLKSLLGDALEGELGQLRLVA
jgi:hypothetical protein